MDFLDMFKAECTVLECRKSVQCEYSTEVPDCDGLPSSHHVHTVDQALCPLQTRKVKK